MLRLLPTSKNNPDRDTTVQWWGGDNELDYTKNLKIIGNSWDYINKPVTYTINSQGYRCKEFDKLDWENSYSVLGCSHIFGEGNAFEDCIPQKLESFSGTTCINLGVSASASEHCFLNAQKIFSYTKVKKIIIVWPYLTRENLYDEDYLYRYKHILKNMGMNNTKKNLLYKWLEQTITPTEHWKYLKKTYIEILTQLYGDRFINFSIEELEMEFGGATNETLEYDLARDRNHYGPQWNTKVAKKILKEINND